MKKVFFLVIAFFFLTANSSLAKDYYVSKTGADRSSCISSPGAGPSACLTIQYVIGNGNLRGGDTVYIQAGTYNEWVQMKYPTGGSSDSSRLVFKNYQNDDVTILSWGGSLEANIQIGDFDGSPVARTQYITIDGSGTDNGHHIIVDGNNGAINNKRGVECRNCGYITLRNLEVKGFGGTTNGVISIRLTSSTADETSGGSDPGVGVDGTQNSIIENCILHGAGQYTIKITGWNTNNNIIRNNTMYGAYIYAINSSGDGYDARMPTGNEYYGNTMYDCDSGGMQILKSPRTKFHDNIVHDNIGSNANGIQVSTGSNNTEIYNNTVYGNGYYGVNVYGNPSVTGVLIYNNVIYDNNVTTKVAEVQVQSGSSAAIYNNSIKRTSGAVDGIQISSDAGSPVTVTNNIVYQGGTGYAFRNSKSSGVTVTYNDFYKTSANPTSYGGATQNNNIGEDPGWDTNYRLTSSSPQGTGHVRDGGVDLSATFTTDKDGISRPQGSAWDMGAYAYDDGLTAPAYLRIVQ